jgi:hypothetical protein
MSIKTLRKRIALVAVASLGFGLISTVPAIAALPNTALAVDALAVTTPTRDIVLGATAASTATISMGAAGDGTKLGAVSISLSKPSGSAITVGDIDGAGASTADILTDADIAATVTSTTNGTDVVAGDVASIVMANLASASANHIFGTLSIKPDVVGTYVVTLTGTTLASPAVANSVTATFTVVAIAADRTTTLTTGTAAGDTTITTVKPTNRPNVSGVYTLGFKAAIQANETNTLNATVRSVLSRPAGSSATVTLANNAATANGIDGETIAGAGTAALKYTFDGTNAAVSSAAGTLQVDATVNVDVVGTYSVLYFVDLNNNSAIDTGEAYYSQTLSVVADAPALAVKVYGATTIAQAAGDDLGALVQFTLTNGGAATSLSGTELISLSGITTFATGGNTAKTSLTRADFDADGVAYIQAATATAGTYVLTVQGVGGGVASILKTTSIKTVTATALTGNAEITSFAKTNTTGVGTDSDNDTIKYAASTTVTYKATGATTAGATTFEAADVVEVRIADTDGTITGTAGLGYVEALTLGTDATASVSVTFASDALHGAVPTAGSPDTIGTVTLDDTTDNVKTVRTALALAKGFTVSPNATVRAKNASTITTTATLKDQFGIALPNVAVTATLASGSRNSGVVVVQNLVSNASGQVTFSYTDAPLAANAALTTDTWAIATAAANQSAAADGGAYAAGALTVTFAATLGITKVVVDTPNTTAGVANPTVVNTGINAGSSGASATTATVTATVTDASGSIVVGVPVTFTISGTTAAVTSTTATSYTGSTGIATAKVYGWATGSYTVTATADGISGTGSVSFAQEDPTYARNVSATAQGAIVTALVKDRFGNPVKGVTVYATKTGTGYFGNGLSSTSGTTNSAGIVEFNVAGGEAVVTVSAVDPSAAAGTTYGQTCAAVGFTSCAATATALKAATVGTSLLDETNVGASLAPAGNASATATAASDNSAQTAADAAAEATDAANAATDAANAAAEAADAATAAAQDAADAVAALSTQVSEMVDALKKQITALTNLVIKIQKKVRA